MIQPKKFKYTLSIRDVEEEILFPTPDGWLQTNIKYARSKIYGGVIRSLTLPLKFVFNGASLLRREFYTYGLLARVNLFIYKLDPATWLYTQLYFGKLDFSKWNDESTGVTINAIENNINVQVAAFADVEYAIPLNVNTTARNAWIASRGYDPMVDILLTPLQLEETADIIFNTSPDFRMNAFFQLSIADYQQMSINPSVRDTGFFQQGAPIFADLPYYFFIAQTKTKIRINTAIDPVNGNLIPGSIQTSINGPSGGGVGQYQFNVYDQTGTLRKTLAQSPPVIGTVEFTFSFDFSLDLNAGDKLYFYILNILDPFYGVSDVHHGVNMQSGSFSLTYMTSTPASHCQALRPAYIFDYIVQQMNGTENPPVETQSFLLEGPLYCAAITCSNAIMTSQVATIYQAVVDNLQIGATYKVFGGIIHYVNSSGAATDYGVGDTFKALLGSLNFTTDPDQDGFVQQENNNPQLIYSFNSFFRTFFGVMGAQMGVGLDPANGKYCLEDLRYFYRSSLLALDLGTNIDIDSPKIEVNADVAVNTINCGYSNQQYAALNGGQEVNSATRYSTSLVAPQVVLDITSPTRADPYGIEEKRIQPGFQRPTNGLSGSFYLNSAASRSDNDNFFVWIKKDPEAGQLYYQPLTLAEGTLSYSGVDGSYYNWMLTPKQNLLRGSNYLASIFDKMGGQMIYLTSAPKNSSLVTVDLTGRRVAEADPINISDLGSQIFLPYYASVNTGLKFNAEELLSKNPFGEIHYTDRGIKWRGFIQEISVDEGENSPQTFKLVLSPANDMRKRIF